jgi:hypothetical protein
MEEIPSRTIDSFEKSYDYTMSLWENAPFLLPPTKAIFPNLPNTWQPYVLLPGVPSFLFPRKAERAYPPFSTPFGNPYRLDPVG